MPTNDSNYEKAYMRDYIKDCPQIKCETCGGKYRKYSKYHHDKTKKHQKFLELNKNIEQIEVHILKDRVNKLEEILNKQRTEEMDKVPEMKMEMKIIKYIDGKDVVEDVIFSDSD